jgi:hypothetical protein
MRPQAARGAPRRAAFCLRSCALVLPPLLLIGCALPGETDAWEQQQQEAFRPKGINAANLAAMVANPADLAHGQGDTAPERKTGAQAVTRLWEKPPTSLQPSTGSTDAAPTGMQPLAGGQSGGQQGSSASGSAAGAGAGAGAGAAGGS